MLRVTAMAAVIAMVVPAAGLAAAKKPIVYDGAWYQRCLQRQNAKTSVWGKTAVNTCQRQLAKAREGKK